MNLLQEGLLLLQQLSYLPFGGAPGHRFLHQRDQMPRKGAPWWREDRVLFRLDRRHRHIEIDDEELPNEVDIAEPERFRRRIGADDLEPDQALSHERAGSIDMRIVGTAARRAPAVFEHVRIKEIGGTKRPRSGESIYFRDPDGHLLELATPGLWPGY